MNSRLARALALLSLLGVLACVAYVAGGPLSTDDAWWHLKLGETYATEGPWPAADPLLHTAHDEAPIQHEWLFDVALHGWNRAFGFQGLRLLHVALLLAIVSLAFSALRRASGSSTLAAAGTCVFLALAWPRLVQLRPDLPSIAATLLLYHWLCERQGGPEWRAIVASALLAGLWANLHSLFAVGLLLVAASAGAAWLEWGLLSLHGRRQVEPARPDPSGRPETAASDRARKRAIRLTVALAAVSLTTLLNPRGVAQHLTYFRSSAEHAIWQIRDEWFAFDPFSYASYTGQISRLQWGLTDALLLLFALALTAWALQLVAGFAKPRSEPFAELLAKVDAPTLAWAVASCVALFASIRFLWLAIFPLLVLARASRSTTPAAGALRWGAATTALAIGLALPFSENYQAFAAGTPRKLGAYFSNQAAHRKYHGSGVAFLEQSGFEGKLFNSYSMGGYLGYWLAPKVQTFVDGRTEHYLPEVLDHYAIINRAGDGARVSHLELLEHYEVDAFFGVGLPVDGDLYTTAVLEDTPGWILVHRKPAHSIYVRDLPRNRAALDRIAAYYEGRGVPFDRGQGLMLSDVLQERPDFAVARKIVPPHYLRWLEESRSGTTRERIAALEALAVVYGTLGLYDAQIDADRSQLSLSPGSLSSQSRRAAERLAWGLLRIGRNKEAEARARDVLDRHPSSVRARQILRAARDQPPNPHLSSAKARHHLTPILNPKERARFWSLFQDPGAG